MQGRFAFVVVTACTQVPSEPAPQLKPRDAAIDDGPVDAAIDAPPDALVLVRPKTPPCRRYQHANLEERWTYTFHDVAPGIDLTNALHSSCCVLPSDVVFCQVTEKRWYYIPAGTSQVSTPLYVEHVRLFDKKGKKPWFDVPIEAFEPGPMNDPYGKALPPLFKGHVENDGTAFWLVGDRERLCDRTLPCDELLRQSGACGGYRKVLAPLVKAFCDARGPHVWSGTRFE